MSDADFITVFDAGQLGYRNWWFPSFGLIFIGVGLLLPKLMDSGLLPTTPTKRIWFPRLFLGFAVFWTLTAFGISFGSFLSGRETLLSGKADYLEGSVENFIPMPYQGHASESFTVKGIPFRYSDYEITSGFNQTASHGGPIREGMQVRIWHSGNNILKLEIPKSPRAPLADSLPASAHPPLITFPVFMMGWLMLGVGSWCLIAWLPTAQAKKRWSDRLSIVAGIVFFSFLCSQFVNVKNQGQVFFFGAFIALITWLNVRNTYFCTECGKRSLDSKWFSRTYSCPNCGAKLK